MRDQRGSSAGSTLRVWLSLLLAVLLVFDCLGPVIQPLVDADGLMATDGQAQAAPLGQTGCSPRPPVGIVVTPDRVSRLLNVTITAGRGALRWVRFGSVTNGVLNLPGIPTPSPGDVTITPAPGATALNFVLRQAQDGMAFRVPLVVKDDCDEWSTFVGGGTEAWATPVPTPTPPTVQCVPRPPVTVRTVPDQLTRRLSVTIVAGGGLLRAVRFGAAVNARLELPGVATPSDGNTVYTPPAGSREATFVMAQAQTGLAFQVPIVVVDDCGEWPTFVGGGAEWWATATPTSTPVTATPTPTFTATPIVTIEATPLLPPDPKNVAPPIDQSVVTMIGDSTRFLYTGSNPIQTGVSATIEPVRAAVLRGKVLQRDGSPLSGAVVKVLGHPEYGQTVSRADGAYDLVVNGGGPVTLTFDRIGHLPGQRQVTVPWQQFVDIDDMILIRADSRVTTVTLGANAPEPVQVARGNPQTDADGTRQLTLLFPQSAQATLEMPDGSTQPLTTLNIRATEYTVGPNGPRTMPAELPPNSGYTYAFELNADEAVAAGARHVRFSQPIPVYTENFLNFPIGEPVPLGAYDREQGVWVPYDNGLVIKILGVVGGLATLDIDGSGQPASAQALAQLGVTDPERQRLATLYQAGQSLWRMPIPHFTWPWDANWPIGCEPDSNGLANCYAPEQQDPIGDKPPPVTSCRLGSIIECETQTLGEAIDVAGTPFQLHYRSDDVPGRTAGRTLQIPITRPLLSGLPFPTWAKDIVLQIDVAGQKHEQRFTSAPGQTYTFTWDGKDGYGRVVQGAAPATIRLGYVYRTIALSAGGTQRGFGSNSGTGVLLSASGRRNGELIRWKTVYSTELANHDARPVGLGAWTLSAHHRYDPVGRMLETGNGQRRSADNVGSVLEQLPMGAWAFSGGGLVWPTRVHPAPDGTLYLVAAEPYGVRRRFSDGRMIALPPPPGVPEGAVDMTPGRDGTVYVLYWRYGGYPEVWRHYPDGRTVHVGGAQRPAGLGDGQRATEIELGPTYALIAGPDDSLYLGGDKRIRRISPDGIITTIAGDGAGPFGGDGGPATRAKLQSPITSLAIGRDGSVYFADTNSHRVRQIGTDGIMRTVAGTGTAGSGGDGGPPKQAELREPSAISFGPDGSLYILMRMQDALTGLSWNTVRRIGTDETIRTVVGRTSAGPDVRNGPATQAAFGLKDVAVGADDSVYLVGAGLFRAVRSMPGVGLTQYAITSEDGAELYHFDADGRHLRTQHALTNATLYTFGYDGRGQLATVTDGDGNVTTIERDGGGRPTAIVGPFGQRTALSVDGNGYLATIANPSGDTTTLTYGAGGLLATMRDPRQQTWTFGYDAEGRLAQDADPVGGIQSLVRQLVQTDEANSKLLGTQVSVMTDLNRISRHYFERVVNGRGRQMLTNPAGLATETVTSSDGTTVTTGPDGMKTTTVLGPDPRWGMDAPTVGTTVKTPGGKTLVSTVQRTATLANADDLQSLVSQTETATVNGRAYVQTYNAASRTFTGQTPGGRTRTTIIDAQGRVTSEQVAGLAPTSYAYDARGRLTTVTQGSGGGARTTTLTYNAQGFLEMITDPLSRTVSFTYDLAGRVLSQTMPGNRTVTFGYDANGNTTAITPPGRPAHTFGYSSVNLPTSYAPPSLGAGSWSTTDSYGTDRQLTRVALPTGQSVDLGYDTAGRLSTVTLPRGTIGRGYDSRTGRLTSLTAPGGLGLAFGYDGGLPTSETATGAAPGSIGRTFDNDFRVTAQTVNGAQSVTLGYDQDSLLTSAGGLTLTRSSQNGLVAGSTLGSVSDTWGYTTFGETDSYAASVSGGDVLRIAYTRDVLGRIATKTETVSGTTDTFAYSYDAAGRLFEVRKNGSLTASYTYDANGNRLTAPNLTGTPTYDAQDRLLTYGSNAYTYTADGRLLTKTAGGQTTTYGYDELGNLLTAALPNGTQVEYLVDGRNRRVGKKVNGTLVQGFLYDGQLRVVAELDGAGAVVSRFVYGTRLNVPEYMLRGGSTYRIVADHLGSPRLAIDTATGAVAQRLEYDEWGNVLTDTSPGFQPFGFAGGLYDRDTKLVRFGARDYDPGVGRWTAKDPVMVVGVHVNLYAYAEDDPVNLRDIDGFEPEAGLDDPVSRFGTGRLIGAAKDKAWRTLESMSGFQWLHIKKALEAWLGRAAWWIDRRTDIAEACAAPSRRQRADRTQEGLLRFLDSLPIASKFPVNPYTWALREVPDFVRGLVDRRDQAWRDAGLAD